ncbi:MAG: ABC transporter permease [Treponema sp.]|jgi:simple sugar transport system permease protein|nr:ABC transporter permease [Treponema sp.]
MTFSFAFFFGPWSSPWFFGNTLDGIALLLTASLGAAIAFRGGTFNLGGEGQIYLGGLTASVVLLTGRGWLTWHHWAVAGNDGGLPAPILLILAALTAMVTGALLGGFSGLLKKKFGMNELISSFLLSSALIPLADYLVKGPWRDSTGNLLALSAFSDDLMLSRLLPPSNLSTSFIFALLLVFCGHVFINRTSPGYQFRISGAALDFARFGGIDHEKAWIPAMSISGALFALAGFFAVAGTYGRCHAGFPGGLGWSAIAVAFIAGNRPLALLPAALVFGWLKSGSDLALLATGLNLETSSFIQAVVLLFATVNFVPRERCVSFRERFALRLGKKSKTEKGMCDGRAS